MKTLLVASLAICAACSTPGSPPGGARGPYRDRAEAQQAWSSMTHEEQAWVMQHPDAARELGSMSPEQRETLLKAFQNLPPETQQQMRENPELYLRKK